MKKITRKHLERFLEKHKTNDLILDIGAGTVSTNHSYTQFFPNRHTVDLDPGRKPDTVADIHELPFEDESYSVILCTEVLEHSHSPHLAVDEMYRVLKKGGKIILTTRFVYPLHDVPNDFFRFTKYGLQRLFHKWKDVEIESETKTFSALGALLQRIGFQTSVRGGKFTKAIIYLMSYFLTLCDALIIKEYGDIQKRVEDKHIMSTGYYVVAIKS